VRTLRLRQRSAAALTYPGCDVGGSEGIVWR
jgi:hypothetical protein